MPRRAHKSVPKAVRLVDVGTEMVEDSDGSSRVKTKGCQSGNENIKRQKNDSAQAVKVEPSSSAPLLVSNAFNSGERREIMAVRIQRVWRTVFRYARTQIFARAYLQILTIDYVKSIRCF
jgi:hypothetical protein